MANRRTGVFPKIDFRSGWYFRSNDRVLKHVYSRDRRSVAFNYKMVKKLVDSSFVLVIKFYVHLLKRMWICRPHLVEHNELGLTWIAYVELEKSDLKFKN